MTKYNNAVYDPSTVDYQDDQQRQVAACREFYQACDNPLNLHRVSAEEVFKPAEKSLVPFTFEVEAWMEACKMFSPGSFQFRTVVVDSRLYLEF